MNPIIIEFLDGVIRYHEQSNDWTFDVGDSVVGRRKSLAEVKVLAANHGKEKSKFDRHVVLYRNGPWGDIEAADITSYSSDPDYKGRRQAWISRKDKSREFRVRSILGIHHNLSDVHVARAALVSSEELFEYCPENNDIVVQVEALEAEKDKLSKKIKALEDELTPYTFRKTQFKKS